MNLSAIMAFALAFVMIAAFAWQIYAETSYKAKSDSSATLSDCERELLKKVKEQTK